MDRAGVGLHPLALELAVVAVVTQHPPGLFGGDQLHPLEYIVRHARAPIRKALEGVQAGESDQVLTSGLNAHSYRLRLLFIMIAAEYTTVASFAGEG